MQNKWNGWNFHQLSVVFFFRSFFYIYIFFYKMVLCFGHINVTWTGSVVGTVVLKPAVGQNVATHALPTARMSSMCYLPGPFNWKGHSFYFQSSPYFLTANVFANTASYVDSPNKNNHLAHSQNQFKQFYFILFFIGTRTCFITIWWIDIWLAFNLCHCVLIDRWLLFF